MRLHLSWCFIGTLALWLTPLPLLAQPTPLGGEFRVNTTTSLDQEDPQVAMDANGNSVVVWADGDFTTPGLDGSSLGIVGQHYDSTGAPMGGEFVVNSDTLGAQNEPAVAMDANGNFVVVWTDTADFGGDGDGDNAGIAGQLFDSTGTPVGSQFLANDLTAYQQTRADVEMDANGNFLVAWGDFFPGPESAEFQARLFDSTGTPVAGQFQVNTFTPYRQYRSDIGFDANGDFVIAWSSAVDNDENYEIVARRYDSAGNPLSGEIQVNAFTTGEQRQPSLAVAAGGEFVVAWQSSGQDGSSLASIGRRFDSAGNPLGGEFQLNTYTTSIQERPEIAMDAAGNLTAIWVSSGQDGDRRGVFAQQFDAAANPTGTEFQVNTYTPLDQGYGFRGPDIAMDDNGNFTVVWADDGGFSGNGQDGSKSGVYAQRYEGNLSDPTLVGHWPLDEGAGTTAADTSSNGLNGSLENGAGWTPGQQNSGGLFDGSNDLIRVLDSGFGSPIDVTNALTLSLWVRPDDVDGSTQVLVSKDESYELEFGKLGASTWDLRLDNVVEFTATTPVKEGIWQHLAITWDGLQICGYYNGLLDSCAAHAATLTPNDRDLGFAGRPTPLLEGGPVFHFEGALDEIYVYNRAFTGTEIADLVLAELTDVFPPVRSNLAPTSSQPLGTTNVDLTLDTDEDATCRYDTSANTKFDAMANAFTTTGGTAHSTSVAVADGQIYTFYVRCRDALGNTDGDDVSIVFGVDDSDLALGKIATWSLSEGSGCTTAEGTNGFDGTLGPNCPTNAPAWSTGHDGGAALTFDDQDDLVTVANDPLLATPAGLTLSAWVRRSGASWYLSIVDVRDSGSDGYDLYIDSQSKLFMRVNSKTLSGQTSIADGNWHHLVGTYDGNDMRLYVDGQLDASSIVGAETINVGTSLKIGRNFSSANNALDGDLSRLEIWNRGLSAVEVLDLYLTTR